MLHARLVRGLLRTTAILALGVPLFATPLGSVAQEGTPAAGGPPPIPAGCTAIAGGLYNPRGVALGPDGTLYVAEAGDGGTEQDFPNPGPGTPTATQPVTSHGPTGQVTAIAPDGTAKVVASGLPSYVFGTELVGPAGIAVGDGKLYVAVGGPGPLTPAITLVDNANSVVEVDLATGAVKLIADLGAYEIANNPDPNAVDSNVAAIALGADGQLYVADAGGNDIVKVDPASGAISVLAVIPGLPSPGGAANPARGGKPEVDPVPTSVVLAPDGGVYVGLLSGAILWGTPGATKIVHIAQDGTITDAATGLDMVVGVATGADGTLYASQLSANLLAQPPAPGAVARIGAGGTPEAAVSGLWLPYGIAIGADGGIDVAVSASAPPGTPPQGQVLSCQAGTSGGATPAASASVDLVDIAFNPTTLTIPANTDVTVTLNDTGVSPHNFNINALNVHSASLTAGQSGTVTVNAAPGTYQYYCAIPGHKEAGMVGTLTVQ
jgi:plastocyanin/glucose/arabinose dehydrogenase